MKTIPCAAAALVCASAAVLMGLRAQDGPPNLADLLKAPLVGPRSTLRARAAASDDRGSDPLL
jgi:hypothetical protein